MASHSFPNYLLAHRKRLALSQREVACLLGADGGAKVCRYERFVRIPSLETALAYEAAFRRPVRELFGGLYAKIQKDVAARARVLVGNGHHSGGKALVARKREILGRIAARAHS